MKIAKKVNKDLLRIANFIIFDAIVFHEVLSGIMRGVESLRKVSGSYQKFLSTEWTKILKKDYGPVFGIAKEILDDFPSSPETENILRELINVAISVISSGILIKHDFMGRIYHKLLLKTTRKFFATYFTSVPAAWLLANLIFKTRNTNWDFSNLDELNNFCILDPACGSGTLLSASYMAMKDNYILSRPDKLDLKKYHKMCIENILHGWDILDYATHLTLTTLALHNYRYTFSDSNIFTLHAGITKGGKIHLGSLDCLAQQITLTGKGFSMPTMRRNMSGTREEEINPPKCDVVIMNPPFSRSAKPNVKFGYSGKKVQDIMNEALRKLTKDLDMEGIGQAGLGAHFILLGNKLLKDNGRIGVVIPRAILSGVSWSKIRTKLMMNYEILYIISNYDPGDKSQNIEPWNWSENTSLGEVLIIAEKTKKSEDNKKVLFVNLWNKPKNEVESLLISQQILNLRSNLSKTLQDKEWEILKLNQKEIGCIYYIPQQILKTNWLCPCLFANPELNAFVITLLKSENIPKVNLSQLVKSFGVDIKQVKDNFIATATETPYRFIWGHQSSMNTIFLNTSFLGYGKAKKDKISDNLFILKKTNLLIAERPHLKTECLIAVETEEPVLGTAFWEMQLNDDNVKPLILLWLNSTLGLLLYLAISTNSMGEIFKTKKDQLMHLPVLDPTGIDLNKCKMLYKNLRNSALAPFPSEFALASQNRGIRKTIDDFFINELGLNLDLTSYYKILTNESILTLKRL